MDLRSVANSVIQVVNPDEPAVLKASAGYVTQPDGVQVPRYTLQNVMAQVQSATYRDLQQTNGLNINGSKNSIYLRGVANGVVRVNQKGGDLIVFASGVNAGTWLVVQVLEQWPDWCKVAVTQQNGS